MSNEQKELLIRDNDLIRAVSAGSLLENKILYQAMFDFQKSGRAIANYPTQRLVELTGIRGTEKTYSMFKKVVPKLLAHKIIIIHEGEKSVAGFNVVTFAQYKDGIFTIELNQRLLPYLVDISSPYTAIDMKSLRSFGDERKSRNFSMRLYEILRTKQYLLKNADVVTEYFSISDLKIRTGIVNVDEERAADIIETYGLSEETVVQLGGDHYPVWKDFRKRVLDPAVCEISEKTDLRIAYKPVKTGRSNKVVGVVFSLMKNGSRPDDAADHEDTSVCNKIEMIDEVRRLTGLEIGDFAIENILSAAEWDIDRVKAAYSLAERQNSKIHDMSRWLLCAVRENWAEREDVFSK